MGAPYFTKFLLIYGRSLYITCTRIVASPLQRLNEDDQSPTSGIRKYTVSSEEDGETKKKKMIVPKVNILLQDKSVISMSKEQAIKWAKRREVTLSPLSNPPKFASYAGREVYEAFTKSQVVELATTDLERDLPKDKTKHRKTLDLSPKIAPHDLNIKLKQVPKWLKHKYHVRIVVRDDGTGSGMTKTSNTIKELYKHLAKVSFVKKPSRILVTLLPVENTVSEPNSKEETGHNS